MIMECTIGWIKTKEGFILFKNRDRKKGELKENYFYKDDDVISFEDRRFNGCWAGINRNGIGIVSSLGPYQEIPAGYKGANENFGVNKEVLLKGKTVNGATELYIRLFQAQKIGKSCNVIICDKKCANIIELVLDRVNVKTARGPIFRTNHFETMKEYNVVSERTKRSFIRLGKVLELTERVKEGRDLISVLKFHSENEYENICRHDYALTVGSVIFEAKQKEITIYSLLNISPCRGEYKKETFYLTE